MMAARYRYAGELAPCVTLNDPAVTAKDAQRIVSTGRSDRIRTSGPCVPNTVLYQAELHSGRAAAYSPGARKRQGAVRVAPAHPGQTSAMIAAAAARQARRRRSRTDHVSLVRRTHW